MKYPPVKGYGDFVVESLEDYLARWPAELSTIPNQVVEDWIYRHWRDFEDHWSALKPHLWTYETTTFSNAEILSIDHVGTWIQKLDAEGVEYVTGARRSTTRLAQYMLTNGSFPVPIIVAQDAGHVVHPRNGGELMKEPFQLIEGHCRLACLRGMINSKHPNLGTNHKVWLVAIPHVVPEA